MSIVFCASFGSMFFTSASGMSATLKGLNQNIGSGLEQKVVLKLPSLMLPSQ